MVIGSWWMLREIEASNLRASLVQVFPSTVPVVSITLPASKNDSAAAGATRTHACVCRGAPGPGCPAHAAWDQLLVLRSQFPEKFADGIPLADLPFFPDLAGQPVTKAAFTATILDAARQLGVPACSPDGMTHITGHSLRPTGAQGLSRLGVDTWAVQLLGRWGSTAVLGYVREAAASPEAALARRSVLGQTLGDAVDARTRGVSVQEVLDTVAADFRSYAAARADEIRTELLSELRGHLARAGPAAGAPPSTSSSSSSSMSPERPPRRAAHPQLADDSPDHDFQASDPGPPSSDPFPAGVSSELTGKSHVIAVGFEACAERQTWVTACGWRFGLTSGARRPRPEDRPCRRCAPA